MNVLNEVNYKILSVVSESIVDDPEKRAMLARVKKDGYALEYASEELRDDPKFVLELVEYVYNKNSPITNSISRITSSYPGGYISHRLLKDKKFQSDLLKIYNNDDPRHKFLKCKIKCAFDAINDGVPITEALV